MNDCFAPSSSRHQSSEREHGASVVVIFQPRWRLTHVHEDGQNTKTPDLCPLVLDIKIGSALNR